MNRLSAESRDALIEENSKRIVSLRMNTSDYGRVKAIARRFRVRDSEVLRMLLKVGLDELDSLYQQDVETPALAGQMAAHGATLVEHLALSARRLDEALNAGRVPAARIAPEDLELVVLAAGSPAVLAGRLQALTGTSVTAGDALVALQDYFLRKYAPGSAEA
ncbi:MAG: hypothetical protein AB7O21_15800 [Gammaproteobacteria bacterium]